MVPVGTLSKRLNCVQVWFNDDNFMLLFNLYMLRDNGIVGKNIQEYQDILSEISVVCQSHNAEHVIISGDFNTDFSRHDHQTAECILFCQQEKMKSCGLMPGSSVVYAYGSHTNGPI